MRLLRYLVSRHADPPDSAELLRMPRQEMPDWVAPPDNGGELLFERIAINQEALCIECMACGLRSAVNRQNCAHIRPGNKTRVRSVTFRCQRHGCGSNSVWLFHAHTQEEATMWLAGDRLPAGREV